MTGSFTVNAADNSPQMNNLVDSTSSATGGTCIATRSPDPSSATFTISTTANCTYDLDADGLVTIIDLSIAADAFNANLYSANWNRYADLDLDGIVSILDLALIAGDFLNTVSHCTDGPGYPIYLPGGWNGSLADGYQWGKYLLFTGAMKYLGSAAEPCAWAFVSISSGTNFNLCDAAGALVALGNSVAGAHRNAYSEIFIGPNDCFDLFLPQGKTLSQAANKLADLISYANNNTPASVLFRATVDDEGYMWDNNANSCSLSEPLHIFQTGDFFADYHARGLNIGPAGGPRYTAGDQNSLSQTGHGLAIPQIYTVNDAQNEWPAQIAYGYAAIQAWPTGGEHLTSDAAEWLWYQYHKPGHPPLDFNWTCAGLRC